MLYITDNIDSLDLDSVMAAMPPGRRAKALAYKREAKRRECAAAYALLRQGLLAEWGIDEAVELGAFAGGKPFIVGREDIFFNLSHCPVAVACVLADRPVGVDIERVRPFKDSLARRVLGEREYAEVVVARRPDIAFTRYWTMKESYLKMTGEGIRRDLRTLPLDGARFETLVNTARGYVCTVCTSK